jgi:uncharacterized delta-60 repeat protein
VQKSDGTWAEQGRGTPIRPAMTRRLPSLVACVCAALALLSCAGGASAQTRVGRLDPGFGTKGRTITQFGIAGEEADVELAITPNGSAVVANATFEGAIVRFLPDGSQDGGFGEGGELSLDPETAAEGVAERHFFPGAVAVDSRGRILVFGQQADSRQTFLGPWFSGEIPASWAVVLRFTAEGKPDPGFGEGKGFIRSDFGLASPLETDIPMVGALAGRVDSRDRPVLVAGVSSATSGCYNAHGGIRSRPIAVVRLTESGQPDPTFGGGDGISPIEGTDSFPGLAIDGEDRPVVSAGRIGNPHAECQFGTTLFRLRRDGERMAGFGSDGVRVFKRLNLGVLEPSGAMVLSYRRDQTLDLARLRPDGRRDMGFGRAGMAKVHLPFEFGFHVRPVAVDAKGRVLLAGFIGSPVATDVERLPKRSAFVVARLLPNGELDRGFGKRGWIITSFARPLEVTSAQATLDPKGRLLVAGTVTKQHHRVGGAFLIARYLLGP